MKMERRSGCHLVRRHSFEIMHSQGWSTLEVLEDEAGNGMVVVLRLGARTRHLFAGRSSSC